MAFARTHALVMTAPDDPAFENNPSDWNEDHSVSGADVGGIPYCPTATTETTSANLTYAETNGPRLQVGSGTTTARGLILGYSGTSNIGGGVWSTAVTPSISNAMIIDYNGVTNIASPARISFYPGAANEKFAVHSTAGRGIQIVAETATTDVNALNFTQTWNASGVAFTGFKGVITDTDSAAGSLAMQILGGAAGATNILSIGKDGRLIIGDQTSYLVKAASNTVDWYSGAGNPMIRFSNNPGATTQGLNLHSGSGIRITSSDASGTPDVALTRGGSNQLVQADGAVTGGGTAASRAEINKAVTAFTDAAAKTVFTLTIPNAAHSASYLVRVTGSLGAGGAIGANEASATNCYVVTLTRTAGVNATAAISAAFGAAATAVAGAATVTCTAALAAVSGGVGASNTIDIQATITRSGGSSDNHTCVATASLLNANSSGITIA